MSASCRPSATWLGSCLGNTFYWVLIASTLGRFFPEIFGDGTNPTSIIVSLIGVWAFHFMILRGVREATFVNKIVTVAKIVPLIVAVLIFIFFFMSRTVLGEFLRRRRNA